MGFPIVVLVTEGSLGVHSAWAAPRRRIVFVWKWIACCLCLVSPTSPTHMECMVIGGQPYNRPHFIYHSWEFFRDKMVVYRMVRGLPTHPGSSWPWKHPTNHDLRRPTGPPSSGDLDETTWKILCAKRHNKDAYHGMHNLSRHYN